MEHLHHYTTQLEWTGNNGSGTNNYKSYERSYTVSVDNKPPILGSSDSAFRGDVTKYNPEDLLVSSLSACHMLWYLHLCSAAGIIVVSYTDKATGTMIEKQDGSGCFTEVTLHPTVFVADSSMIEMATQLHKKAHAYCFIANSVNFPVKHLPTINSDSV